MLFPLLYLLFDRTHKPLKMLYRCNKGTHLYMNMYLCMLILNYLHNLLLHFRTSSEEQGLTAKLSKKMKGKKGTDPIFSVNFPIRLIKPMLKALTKIAATMTTKDDE